MFGIPYRKSREIETCNVRHVVSNAFRPPSSRIPVFLMQTYTEHDARCTKYRDRKKNDLLKSFFSSIRIELNSILDRYPALRITWKHHNQTQTWCVNIGGNKCSLGQPWVPITTYNYICPPAKVRSQADINHFVKARPSIHILKDSRMGSVEITTFFFPSPSHLLSSPFYSLSLPVVTHIRGHIAGSSPPSPLRFVRRILSREDFS